MYTKYSLAIIGAGKVGQSLGHLFSLKHYKVSLIGRDIEQHQQCISSADVILITTSDGAIESVCKSITPFLSKGTVVSHCSGALNSSALLSAKQKGGLIASTHPLNTFPSLAASLETFKDTQHGTALFSEGDDAALTTLTPIFQTIGFKVIEIASETKIAYHTACVLACNYLTVLMDLSLTTAEHGGIDKTQFWQAVQPLIQATLTNITEHGTIQSLSGPIARGDTKTIDQHIDFLTKKDQSIGDVYLSLAEHALRLAKQQGTLSNKKIDELKTVLDRQ